MLQLENAVKRYNKIILSELKEAGIVCWLAGGALRDYFMGVVIKTDYDIFFPSESDYNKAKEYFKSRNAEVKWESENGMKLKHNGKTFDLVKKFFDSPQQTIDNFDFTVSMFAVDFEKVYHGESTFIDLAKRQLMINKITYPASTMSRAFRYHKKGFSMCLGEMRKIYDSIQNAPKHENEPESENEIVQSSGDNIRFFTGID